MIRKLFLLTALTACITVQAHELGDTLVIRDAHKVTIVTNDSLQKIKVMGMEDNEDYVYENSIQLVDSNYVGEQRTTYHDLDALGFPVSKRDTTRHRRGVVVYGTMHWWLGFNAGISPDFSFSTFRSLEAAWNILQFEIEPYHNYRRTMRRYEFGLALQARNYRFDMPSMLKKDATGSVFFGDFPVGTEDRKSDVYIFSLTVPLQYSQRLGHRSPWRIKLGVLLNFNCYGTLRNSYTMGDYDYEETLHKIDYRPFTVDLMGIIRYKWLGFYGKYSPMSVFKKGRGPEFRSLSFGLYL